MAGLLDDLDVPCPDVIIYLNDVLVIGAIYELQRRGACVSQDI